MTKKKSIFWYNTPLSARLIGLILFFLPGIFLIIWGLIEMNQDHQFLFITLGGLLLCFTFIRLSMQAEGYYLEANRLVVWKGYHLLLTTWKSQHKSLPYDSLKWKVQSHTSTNANWEMKNKVLYRMQVWSKTTRSGKKWKFQRNFEDRKQARDFVTTIKEHLKSLVIIQS